MGVDEGNIQVMEDVEMIMGNCPTIIPTVHTCEKQLWCTNQGNLYYKIMCLFNPMYSADLWMYQPGSHSRRKITQD